MTNEAIKMANHIFQARIDNSGNGAEYLAWATARDVFQFALGDNLNMLKKYDDLLTRDEQIEKGLWP